MNGVAIGKEFFKVDALLGWLKPYLLNHDDQHLFPLGMLVIDNPYQLGMHSNVCRLI